MSMEANALFESRFTLWLVAGLTILLFAFTNVPWQLDTFSQDRQALASFQMVKEGRWFYQQAPRSRRLEREATKPPLLPWISAGLYGLTRSWDLAWRLPAFAAAIALALVLFRRAREIFGRAAAVLALSAFSLNMFAPRMATLVRTDMVLALIVFAIGAIIWDKVHTGAAWSTRDRWSIFALFILGNYSKGPIVYVFILAGVAAYQIARRKRPWPSAWFGWWPVLGSLGVFLLWVVGGIVTQPAFFDQVVMHEFFGRFGAIEHRPMPPSYYAAHLLQKFAPWAELLLAVALLSAWRNRESLRRMSPATIWLCCWSLGGLLFMSFVSSKRLDRIFPVIPPLSLLVAAQYRGVSAKMRPWFVVAFAMSILLAVYYSGYSKIYLGLRENRDALSDFGKRVRAEATARGWRYETVTGHDGGLLLYLEKAQFLDIDTAIAKWNRRELDALIAENDEVAQLLRDCNGATDSGLYGIEKSDERGRKYVLVTRGEKIE